MHYQTKGIVLKTFDYNDSSIIVKVYTEHFGLQSYLVNASRGKKSKVKVNLFQPLSLIDMVVSRSDKNRLEKMKEIKIDVPYTTIVSDIVKSSITLFLNEIIYKSVREEEPNENLFHFIRNSMLYLDLRADGCANFHLSFLVHFSRHLGFYPSDNMVSANSYFNLKEGVFQADEPAHEYFLSKKQTVNFSELRVIGYEELSKLVINNQDRRELLDKLVQFYELHLNNNDVIASHRILEEIIA